MIKEFMEKYDDGSYTFPNCLFRPGAYVTTPFGLDNTFEVLRTHLGVDRGYSSVHMYKVLAPFNFVDTKYLTDMGTFGALLMMPVKDADFELRIAHFRLEDFKEPYLELYTNNKLVNIPKDAYFADAGNYGLSSGMEIVKGKAGAHTHTEVVSKGYESSEILNFILSMVASEEDINTPYSSDDIKKFAIINNKSESEYLSQYEAELKKRAITFLNKYKCVRKDYYSGETRTFYSSKILFGF